MKNFQGYKTISEYQKNSAEIITTNIDIPNIYNRIVVLSTLNTGVNPYDNNIIEISCMELMGGKITGYEFDAFLHPRYTINEVIKQKTNLNNNFYEDFFDGVYSSDKNVMIQFKKFVKQSRIIIFNSLKEIDFINNELNYHKIGSFQKNRFYSLINIFRQMFPHASQNILTLNKCCEFLEIQIPKEKYHSSKHDCFIACKILAKFSEKFIFRRAINGDLTVVDYDTYVTDAYIADFFQFVRFDKVNELLEEADEAIDRVNSIRFEIDSNGYLILTEND